MSYLLAEGWLPGQEEGQSMQLSSPLLTNVCVQTGHSPGDSFEEAGILIVSMNT